MTETSEVRANRDGHPCPAWCVTDHGQFSFHGAELISVETAGYRTTRIRPIQFAGHGVAARPEIQVAGDGMFSVSFSDGESLAAVIDELATATPEQHRELAAAIRQAVEQIKAAV